MTKTVQALELRLEATTEPQARVALLSALARKLSASDPLRARTLSQEAHALAQTLANPTLEMETLIALGQILRSCDEPQAAIEHFRQALEIAGTNAGPLQIECLMALTESYRQLGDFQNALHYFEQLYQLRETVINLETRYVLEESERKHQSEAAQKEADLKWLAAEALRASEARYRALVEASEDAIFQLTPEGYYIFINATAERWLKLPREQVVGKRLRDIPLANTTQPSLAAWRKMVRARQPVKIEYTLKVNPPEQVLYIVLTPVLDDEGHVESIIGTASDITWRKKIEQTLEESRERFRIVSELTSDIAYTYRVKADHSLELEWQTGKFSSAGASDNEAVDLSRGLLEIIYDADRATFQHWFSNVLAHGNADSIETRLYTTHQELRWARVFAYPQWERRQKQERLTGIYGAIQDITTQKAAALALQRYADRLKTMHALDQAILAARSAESIALAAIYYLRRIAPCQRAAMLERAPNGAFTVLAVEADPPLNSEAATPRKLLNLTTLRQGRVYGAGNLAAQPHLTTAQQKLLSEGIQSYVVIPLLAQNEIIGALTLESVQPNALTESDVETAVEVGVLLAVALHQTRLLATLQQRAADLSQANQQAQEARKAAEAANRAKSTFLANMSHELRTPLNAVLGFAQLLAQDPTLTEKQRQNLTTISQSGEHLLELINNILEISKIEAGRTTINTRNFDLRQLLTALEAMFQLRATEKKIELTFSCPAETPRYIHTDEGKLRQMLINLLDNAIKFTQNGAVTLDVRPEALPQAEHTTQILHFAVKDNGPGLSQEEQALLFQPFEQAANKRSQPQQGAGLGLAISRQFAQMLGGDLNVVSVPAQGSVFTLTLPVVIVTEAALTPARQAIKLKSNQPNYRMLIADDDEASRILMLDLLSPFGFELRIAADGWQTLEIWEAWHPHLIWMDLRMPTLNGHEVARLIKAKADGQTTKIIALTASAFDEERQHALQEGCDDFLQKPFRSSEIFNKLNLHLGLEFIYDDEPKRPPPSSGAIDPASGAPPSDALAGLSPEWLADLYEATIDADLNQITQLINTVSSERPELAEGLLALAHNFEHDVILNLIRSELKTPAA